MDDGRMIIEQVHQLAWAGQHAQAIELATNELGKSRLKRDLQMDLLDLRAESYIAQGQLDLAMKDANVMSKLAKTALLKAKQLNLKSLVQMRMGDLKAAARSASAAVALKHNSTQVGDRHLPGYR
jgi:hypothetical protein